MKHIFSKSCYFAFHGFVYFLSKDGGIVGYFEVFGNLFDDPGDAKVNTINCVGAMGKGIALEYRRRYPEMYLKYRLLCERSIIKPGMIWPYNDLGSKNYIFNFAIKDHWRAPSKVVWLEDSLSRFVD